MQKIVLEKLSKKYNDRYALQDIDLSIVKGESIGIIGESGSGKSTLARILVGLEKYDSGSIFIDGKEYTKLNNQELREKRRSLQLVFQNSIFAVNPNFTVKDVLMEPINILYKNFSISDSDKKIKNILKKLELENIDLRQKARSLSGGQLQRLCFARALIVEPNMLVLDETLSGLDPIVQLKVLKLLKELRKELNLTYIFISHNFYSCYKLCDRVVVLDKAKKVDEISFEGDFAVINNKISEKLIIEDDAEIPYKFKYN